MSAADMALTQFLSLPYMFGNGYWAVMAGGEEHVFSTFSSAMAFYRQQLVA